MRHFIIVVSLFVFFASACNDNASSNTVTPVVVNKNDNAKSNGAKTTLAPAAKLYDVGQEYLFTLLAREFWVYEFYINAGQPENKEHTGDWFHFNPDGTYTSGRWKEERGSGVWKIYYVDGKNLLFMNSTDNTQDAEFEINMGKDGYAASWVGTSRFPDYAQVMLKAIPLSSRPTKKQFDFKY